MPDAHTMNRSTSATAEDGPEALRIYCPNCRGFCVEIEQPEHRLEQNVSFRIAVYCKRCPKGKNTFKRRITFNESRNSRPNA